MKRLLPTLTLFAAIAAPTSASAGTIGGNPALGDPNHLINCTDAETGFERACTFTVDTINGTQVHVPAGKRITGYSGYFKADSMIGLRLMKRNADGTYTSDGGSGYTYATGGVEHFETQIDVPAGDHTIAIDVFSGGVGAVANPNSHAFASTTGVFSDDETAAPGEGADYDIHFNVDVADAPVATPTPVYTSTPDPDTADPDGPKSGFTIERKAILAEDGKSIDVFTSNELTKEIDGKIMLKVGKKTFPAGRISKYDYHSREDLHVPVGGKALQKLLKTGRLSGTVIAKTTGGTFTQKISAIRGGASKYDGTYRGDGPLVIVVKRGVIVAVSETLSCFSSANGRMVTRTMGTGLGFPALIGKDGSFNHKASLGSDEFTYKGKLNPNGVSKGYLSLWYSTFDLDPISNNFRALQYLGADNFEVTRAK